MEVITSYRPELFLDLVHEWGGVDWKQLIHFMTHREFNANHFYIAHLCSKKKLKMILTTNFDYLIEAALDNRNLHYNLCISNDEFDEWKNNNDIYVAKLHGSLINSKQKLDSDTLIGTLKEVGKTLPAGKSKFLELVLNNYITMDKCTKNKYS